MINLEKKKYSQNGEDGITLSLLEVIGETNSKYFVEIGVESGNECNCRVLKDLGFNGLMLDGQYSDPHNNLHKEFITRENINDIFKKYNVPNNFDILSIDIDSNDLYVWQAISENYQPNIVIIEYCGFFPPPISVANEYIANKIWKGTPLIGSSLSAITKVAKSKGYSLVYCEKEGINAFFVKDNFIPLLKEKIPDHPFNDEYKLFRLRRQEDWSFFEADGSRFKFNLI